MNHAIALDLGQNFNLLGLNRIDSLDLGEEGNISHGAASTGNITSIDINYMGISQICGWPGQS